MKRQILILVCVAVCTLFMNGCVAIPPLINVQHKNDDSNLGKRLDSIENRLDRIEKKME